MNPFDFLLATCIASLPLFLILFAVVQTFPKTVKALDKKLSNFIGGAEL